MHKSIKLTPGTEVFVTTDMFCYKGKFLWADSNISDVPLGMYFEKVEYHTVDQIKLQYWEREKFAGEHVIVFLQHIRHIQIV